MTMTATCQNCGIEFVAARKTAKYCSDRCRKASHREATATIEDVPVPKKYNVTQSDLVSVVGRAHAVAADMSRLSAHAEPALRVKFRRAAHGIEETLRGEGL